MAQLQIDPETVRFEVIDLPEDQEDEHMLERALGFVEPEPRPRRSEEDLVEDPEGGEEFTRDETDDDKENGS